MTAPSFTFTLQPDPATPAPGTATGTAIAAAGQVVRPPVKRGLLRPFRLDGKGGFARVSGDDLLAQKLENLLLLEGLPWDPARGAMLGSLLHMNAGPARVFAQAFVSDAVNRYLPELRVERVTAEDRRDGTLLLTVETSKVRDPAAAVTASRVLR